MTYLLQVGGGAAGDKVGLAERIDQGKAFPLISRISDHLPLGLDLFAKAPRDRGEADIPAWAAKIKGFAVAVARAFGEDRINESAFAELDRWKKTVRRVYKQIVQGQKKLSEAYGGQARKLTKAITLYGLAMRTRPDVPNIETMMKKNDFLKGLVRLDSAADNNRYEVERLQEYIHHLYGEGVREEAVLCKADLDKLQSPEGYLPGGNGGGDHASARAEGTTPRGQEPTVVAPADDRQACLIGAGRPEQNDKKYSGVVWAENRKGATKEAIALYLHGYNKRVPAELRPVLPICAEVIDQVHETNDSCAGPDGIPFVIYRSDCLVGGGIASVLHRITKALGEGVRGPDSFNQARLFLIAKTDSLLIQDTRPISVTDCVNRIVASCLQWPRQ